MIWNRGFFEGKDLLSDVNLGGLGHVDFVEIMRISEIELKDWNVATSVSSQYSPIQPTTVIDGIASKIFADGYKILAYNFQIIIPYRKVPVLIGQHDFIVFFIEIDWGTRSFGIYGF